MVGYSSTINNEGYINDSEISRLLDNVFQIARNSGYTGEYYCKELSSAFFDLGMIQTFWRDKAEGFPLRDGTFSPYYINLRTMTSYPDSDKLSAMIGLGIRKKIQEEGIDINRIVGAANTGILIAKSVTDWGKIPSCWNRKIEQVKTVEQLEKEVEKDYYKTRHILEGILFPGDRLMIWDDVITGGGTKLVVNRQVEIEEERREKNERRPYDLELNYVGVIIDREQGGEKILRENGFKLYSLMTFSQCLEWLRKKMHPYEYEMIAAFNKNPDEFQDERLQRQLEEETRDKSPFFKS